jgi:hypothetical protein
MDFFDYDKSAYVRDRLAHGHSIGRRYRYDNTTLIRLYWAPAFKGWTLGGITRQDLKAFSLSLLAEKAAGYKNRILNAGLVPLGWAYNEEMIPADIGKDFERYSGKGGKRGGIDRIGIRNNRAPAGGGSGNPGRGYRRSGSIRQSFLEPQRRVEKPKERRIPEHSPYAGSTGGAAGAAGIKPP